MGIKCLPITYPPITAYTHHAYYLSIMSNYEECLPWIYSNYIQIYLQEIEVMNQRQVYVDYHVLTPEYHYNPWFYEFSQRLTRDTILTSIPNLIKFIKESIEMGYYVWIHLDEFYIPDSPAFQRYKFPHGILVYGYNDDEEMFNTAGFFYQNRSFSFSKATYSQLEQAYMNCQIIDNWLSFTHLLKINTNGHVGVKYHFDLQNVIEMVYDYLNSINTSTRYRAIKNPHESFFGNSSIVNSSGNVYFGIQIYEQLRKYLESDNISLIDHRLFYVIWEQKSFMLKRIKYLEKYQYIDQKNSLYSNYKEIEMKTRLVLNLSLKSFVNGDTSKKNKIVAIMNEISLKEKAILESLLNQLVKMIRK